MQLFDSVVQTFFTFVTLPYKNAFQCICAAVLSIRTRDVVTIKVCKELFLRINTASDLLCHKQNEIYRIIRSVNYSRRKTDMLFKLAAEVWRNDIPKHLLQLSGVGYKVRDVYANAFINNVVAVDSAVFRIVSRVCGNKVTSYSYASDFVKSNISHNLLFAASTSLIKFGRVVCSSYKPKCFICSINNQCKYEQKTLL